ncbi:MAG: hypothetical protein WB689_09085, partial [Xanthobacteraceae bacterium]
MKKIFGETGMRIHAYYSPNQNQVPVLSKAWGWGTTTFKSALKKCEARAVKQLGIESARAPAGRGFAPIDASRGDDERVFDSLHRAGIDIKLV